MNLNEINEHANNKILCCEICGNEIGPGESYYTYHVETRCQDCWDKYKQELDNDYSHINIIDL